jgi:P4 family phage/plasmid primase-like protien
MSSSITTLQDVNNAVIQAQAVVLAAKEAEKLRKAQEKESDKRRKEELKEAEKRRKEELKEAEKAAEKQRREEQKKTKEDEKKLSKLKEEAIRAEAMIQTRSPDRAVHYDGRVFEETEVYDARAVAYIWYHWKELSDQEKIGRAFDPEKKDYVPDTVYKAQFEKFIKELDIEEFPIAKRKVTYSQASYRHGRYVCRNVLGYQGISRPIRHTLGHKYYRDLDVINAHVAFYSIICKQRGLETKWLDFYIENREAIFKAILLENPKYTRDIIKMLFLAALNGGSMSISGINKKRKRDKMEELPELKLYEELENYINEVKYNHIQIIKWLDECHPEYRAHVEKTHGKDYHNLNGSIVNHMLCDMENQVEFWLCDFLKYEYKVDGVHYRLSPDVHCFDGCMINTVNKADREHLNDDLILEAEQYIKLKTGWKISLKFKDFDEMIPISESELNKYTVNDPIFKYFNWRVIDELSGADKVIADLCQRYFQDEYILTSVVQEVTGYTFDSLSMLWKRIDHLSIQNSINDVLLEAVRKGVKYWSIRLKNSKTEEEGLYNKEKLSEWVARLKDRGNWGSSQKAREVFNSLKPMLKNESFIDKLNVTNKYELPIKDGLVIDLTKGETRERKSSDLYDYECPVSYKPWSEYDQKEQSIVNEYMDVMFKGNKEVILYMKRLIGMFLTKDNSNRAIYMAGGSGKNGKSFLFETLLRSILNKSYSTADPNAFIGQGSNFINNLYSMRNSNVAVLSEGKSNKELNTSVLKRISGDDTQSGELKGKDVVSFKMLCKTVLLFNMAQAPKCDATDKALWDRIICLYFPQEFDITKAKENEEKTSFYLSKLDVFFSYFVDGCKEWFQDKSVLRVLPKEIEEATRKFLQRNDIIMEFIEDTCETGPTFKQERQHLYNRYLGWTSKRDLEKMGRNSFYEYIESKFGVGRGGSNSDTRVFLGLRLRQIDQHQEQQTQRPQYLSIGEDPFEEEDF